MIRTLILFPLTLIGAHTLQAQCAASGPLSPGSAASVSYGGSDFNFNNATNVFSSDNSRATSTGLVSLFNGETDYLQATNFGFSIPSAAIICGIVVEAEKSATGIGTVLGIGLSYVSDYSVRLIRNGTVAGNNKASATHWTGTESYHTYGSNSDIWGLAWTPADINASNFGIAFSANIAGLAMLIPNVRIDHIRITVYYLVAILPKEILYFNAAVKDDVVAVEWKATGVESVQVQRSKDGVVWEGVNAAGHWTGSKADKMEDGQPYNGRSYYRLMATKAGGEKIYSAVRSVEMGNRLLVKVFPNIVEDHVMISNINPGDRILLTDAAGRMVPLRNAVSSNAFQKVYLPSLKPGIYFLKVGNQIFKIKRI
jgi:hypothetical protein